MSKRGALKQTFREGCIVQTQFTNTKVYTDNFVDIVCILLSKVYLRVIQVYIQSEKNLVWIEAACGWILAADGGETALTEIIKDTKDAELSWQQEHAKKHRFASAVSSMLVRSYSLPKAQRLARSIHKHAQDYYPNQTPLLKVTDQLMEDIMIILGGQVGLSKKAIFEYIKAASARSSHPRQTIVDICQIVFEIILEKRPSTWVIQQLHVITTEEMKVTQDHFVMAAAEGNLKNFLFYLTTFHLELTCLHSQLMYTALHAAADFGQVAIIEYLIMEHSDLSLDIRDPKRGQTALHFAAYSGRVEVTKLLLAHDSDRTIACTHNHFLPYQAAFKMSYFDLYELLKYRPPAPRSLEVTHRAIDQLAVLWQPPTLNSAIHAALEGYEVQCMSVLEDPNVLDPPLIAIDHPSLCHATFVSLTPACDYRLRIRCYTVSGWSIWSEWIYTRTLANYPSQPEAVDIPKVTTNGLFVTWLAPLRENGKAIDYYELELIDSNILQQALASGKQNSEKMLSKFLVPEHMPSHGNKQSMVDAADDSSSLDEAAEEQEVESSSSKPFRQGEKQPILTNSSNSASSSSSMGNVKKKTASVDVISAQGGLSKFHRVVKHKHVKHLAKLMTGLEPDRLYQLRVRAHNQLGYSLWSVWSAPVAPQVGVYMKTFLAQEMTAIMTWFTPILSSSASSRIEAYELQLCRVMGPRSITLHVHNNNAKQLMKSNKQSNQGEMSEDFFTLSNTLTVNEYPLTMLKAGGRYACRVRAKISRSASSSNNDSQLTSNEWPDWETYGLRSEAFTIPATAPDPPIDVRPHRIANPNNNQASNLAEQQHLQPAAKEQRIPDHPSQADNQPDDQPDDELPNQQGDSEASIYDSQHNSHQEYLAQRQLASQAALANILQSANNKSATGISANQQPSSGSSSTSSKYDDDLAIQHDSITITWTNGDANGENITGYEIHLAKIRIYHHQDLVHAKEAYLGLEEDSMIVWEEGSLASSSSAMQPSRQAKPNTGNDEQQPSQHQLEWLDITPSTRSSATSTSKLSNSSRSSSSSIVGRYLSPQILQVSGLHPGEAYIFRIRQANAIGWSEWSKASAVIATYPSVPPYAPEILALGGSYVVISWEEVALHQTKLTTLENQIQIRKVRVLSKADNYASYQQATETVIVDEGEECEYDSDWQMIESRLLTEKEELRKFLYEKDHARYKDITLDELEQISGAMIQHLVESRYYRVRVRVRTVVGWSPWGQASTIFRTLG